MASRRPPGTRDRIKDVAQELIAQHGVDGISIKDITVAAGQRNMAFVYYYFRNKEELIRELIVDAAEIMEGTRADHLARLEAAGESMTLRQIVHVLISGAKLDPGQGGRNATIMRFIGAVMQSHRALLLDAISDKYDKTYQRCLELMRQRLTHIPRAVLNQRLLFLSTCYTSLLIAREEALASAGHAQHYWSQPGTYPNIVDFMCGGLEAPVTQPELATMAEETAQPPSSPPIRAIAG
jgi:AcrR family transcriptional regulator